LKAIAKRKHETKAAGRSNQDTGAAGERIASGFLREHGYRILGTNYRTPFGEIDIIAGHYGYTVFFEVKTRFSDRFGPPLASITRSKQRHIILNCLFYLKRHKLLDTPCRIDAIGIMLSSEGKLETLEHVKNAVQMELQGQGAWVKGQGRRKYNGRF
jgi:putative endonuclease